MHDSKPADTASRSETFPRIAVALALACIAGCASPLEETRASVKPADVVHRRAAATERPPNFVVILADDLGYGDLGAYGGAALRTPNLDRLAAEGMRFTDFHSSDSVCTPSRAGLLTGRYARRMGLDVPLHPADLSPGAKAMVQVGYALGRFGVLDLATEGGADGLHGEEVTLPEALKVAGYATGMVGKWHLGDFRGDPRHHPMEHGFDRFFGVPYSNDMHPFPLFDDRREVESDIADQARLTGLYTDAAIRFLEDSPDRPFFLYFAHTFPHRPLFASRDFHGRSSGGIYGDTVEELDASVGRVMQALERLGLADDTVVLFSSDNGPWYDGSPGALRGRKGQSFEGGHRVPLLARWPGRIPAGSVSTAASMNIDVFPTFLELAGLAPPADRAIDGRSLASVLASADAASPHERLWFYHEGELEAVREGRWKYFRSVNHYVWPLPVNKKAGAINEHTSGPLPLLFDLERDPSESYNVADREPEAAARLAAAMQEWDSGMEANRKGWKP